MRRLVFLLLAITLLSGLGAPAIEAASWAGVDETVIEKFAAAAGRPAREPFLNTDRGDLLLFVFLVAGMIGGFMAGYYFRVLFPPRPGKTRGEGNQPGGPVSITEAPDQGLKTER